MGWNLMKKWVLEERKLVGFEDEKQRESVLLCRKEMKHRGELRENFKQKGKSGG